jgi:hypothetical protein
VKPNSLHTELYARAKANGALLRIGDSDIVDPVIARLYRLDAFAIFARAVTLLIINVGS